MTTPEKHRESPYLRTYRGLLKGILRWQELEAVWERLLRSSDGGWYVYVVAEPPPTSPATPDEFARILGDIRQRLRDEHDEDYCGIVYADDLDAPPPLVAEALRLNSFRSVSCWPGAPRARGPTPAACAARPACP